MPQFQQMLRGLECGGHVVNSEPVRCQPCMAAYELHVRCVPKQLQRLVFRHMGGDPDYARHARLGQCANLPPLHVRLVLANAQQHLEARFVEALRDGVCGGGIKLVEYVRNHQSDQFAALAAHLPRRGVGHIPKLLGGLMHLMSRRLADARVVG